MSDGLPPADPRQQIRELMGRATLARVRGDRAEALKLAQQALVMNEQNWEVHAFIGDVLMEQNRGADALGSFKRARELNPKRVELEDKVARAAVRSAQRRDQMAYMEAVIEGRAPQDQKRKPAMAGLLSLLLPGLGQLYNGQVVKGAALVLVYLVLMLVVLYASAERIRVTHDYVAGLGAAAAWIVVTAILWVYAIADAALTAGKNNAPDGAGLT